MSTKSLYAVEVNLIVYVSGYDLAHAQTTVRDNLGSALQQAKDSMQMEASAVKLADIEPARMWDRPLGSDKKLVRELVTA